MKKLLSLLAFTGFLIACNNEAKNESAAPDTAAAAETAPAPAPESPATTSAAVKDSVMQFKDGKVMIMIGGSWTALTAPVTTSNGRKVSPDGEVTKGSIKRKMEEGMMIDKDGQMTDKDGKLIDNTGWE